MDHARKLNFSKLCSSATYKQNDSISLRLSDSVQCKRGHYFRAWVLYFSFGIRQLYSYRMYKHNLLIWSWLGDLVRCILSFNFGLRRSISEV